MIFANRLFLFAKQITKMIEGKAADASCGKFLNDESVLHVRQVRKGCTWTGDHP